MDLSIGIYSSEISNATHRLVYAFAQLYVLLPKTLFAQLEIGNSSFASAIFSNYLGLLHPYHCFRDWTQERYDVPSAGAVADDDHILTTEICGVVECFGMVDLRDLRVRLAK